MMRAGNQTMKGCNIEALNVISKGNSRLFASLERNGSSS